MTSPKNENVDPVDVLKSTLRRGAIDQWHGFEPGILGGYWHTDAIDFCSSFPSLRPWLFASQSVEICIAGKESNPDPESLKTAMDILPYLDSYLGQMTDYASSDWQLWMIWIPYQKYGSYWYAFLISEYGEPHDTCYRISTKDSPIPRCEIVSNDDPLAYGPRLVEYVFQEFARYCVDSQEVLDIKKNVLKEAIIGPELFPRLLSIVGENADLFPEFMQAYLQGKLTKAIAEFGASRK